MFPFNISQPPGGGHTTAKKRQDSEDIKIELHSNAYSSIFGSLTPGSFLRLQQNQGSPHTYMSGPSSAVIHNTIAPTPTYQKPSLANLEPTSSPQHLVPITRTTRPGPETKRDTYIRYPFTSSSSSSVSRAPLSTSPVNTGSSSMSTHAGPAFGDHDAAADFDDDEVAMSDFLFQNASQIKNDAELAKHLQLQFDQEDAGHMTNMYMSLQNDENSYPELYGLDLELGAIFSNEVKSHTANLPSNDSNGMELDQKPTAAILIHLQEDDDKTKITDDEKMNLEQMKQYTRSLSSPCAGCRKKHSLHADEIPKMTRKWMENSSKQILCGLPCPANNSFCNTITCPGCQSAIRSTQPWKQVKTTGETVLTLYICCEAGREFAVWALACGWDQPAQISFRESVASKLRPKRPRPSTPNAERLEASPIRKRVLQARAIAKGVGYGGNHHVPYSSRHKSPKVASQTPLVANEERIQESYYRVLTAILPTLDSSHPGMMDSTPPIHLHTLLARSPLLSKAASLLSNDSIEDITRQIGLYDAVSDFVNTLGNHYATSGLVYEERQLFTRWATTLSVSFDAGEKAGKPISVKDTSRSMTRTLSHLAKQGLTLLQHARRNPLEFESTSEKKLLSWLEKVVHISALHEINSRQITGGPNAMEIDAGKGKKSFATDLAKYHQDYAVQELDDDEILQNHYFAKQAQSVQTMPPPKGRMKRLIQEIATLKTSLPPGIFICHGSSRLDVMKILIIGPEGTPYEYGLFEFDLFCPLQYPTVAPNMQFRTTGGGKVRFNPNLYEDVCLSLLGTWQGEPWQPDRSTILQLVVSIQSMIFCEKPYYNEPGHEMRAMEHYSDKYSNDRRAYTVQHAIQPWAKAVPAILQDQQQLTEGPTKVWRKVAHAYLQCFAHDIVNTASTASKKYSDHPEYPIHSQARAIQSVLKKQGYLI